MPPLPADGLYTAGGHFTGEGLVAFFPDQRNTRGPVRPEHKSEYPRHEIVVPAALTYILKLITSGAGFVTPLQAAGPHSAPACLFVFPAPGTFLLQIPRASGAIETTQGYEVLICGYFAHTSLLFYYFYSMGSAQLHPQKQYREPPMICQHMFSVLFLTFPSFQKKLAKFI
jgi:hypothetical protein